MRKGIPIMKNTLKKVLCLVLVAVICASFAGCGKLMYVTNGTIQAINEVKSGDWNKVTEEEDSDEDKIVIDEFEAGTYGGVEFSSIEDVVNYYVEAYNYTKSLTAEYTTEDGSTATYYKLLGDEDLQVENILVDGSSNTTINNLVPTLVNSLFSPSTYGLVPCSNRDPNLDNNSENVANGELDTNYDFRTSLLVADDVLMANVSENEGKIVIQIQPKAAEMSLRGDDSQGHFFEVLGDIGKTVNDIKQLSWSEGTTEENCKVSYKGGVGTVVIDPATKEVTEADYTMCVKVNVLHANVLVLKNKNASLDITYKNHYPASDEYLMKSKKIARK